MGDEKGQIQVARQPAEVFPPDGLPVEGGGVQGELQAGGGAAPAVVVGDVPVWGNQVPADAAGEQVDGDPRRPEVGLRFGEGRGGVKGGLQFLLGLQCGEGESAADLVAGAAHQGALVRQFQGDIGVKNFAVASVEFRPGGDESGGD